MWKLGIIRKGKNVLYGWHIFEQNSFCTLRTFYLCKWFSNQMWLFIISWERFFAKYERLWPSFTFTWDEQIRPFKKVQILYFTPPFFLLYMEILFFYHKEAFLGTIPFATSLKPHNHNHWFIAYYMHLWNRIWHCKENFKNWLYQLNINIVKKFIQIIYHWKLNLIYDVTKLNNFLVKLLNLLCSNE